MLRGLLLAALALASACARMEVADDGVVVHSGPRVLPGPSRNDSATPPLVRSRGDGDTQVQLRLCECERATGPPSGLSCDKEGWFISSWERQGQWVAGGGYVPLSHAICCRPCLPNELPPDPSGRIPAGEAPLAVISLGCHASTDRALSTRCELDASSFVAGYSEAVKVFTTPDTFYPINTVQCCTPALLLANGDAWELERCDCRSSRDPDFPVNCGGTNTHQLLLGYVFFRLSPLGHVVPVGPAQCCGVCLSGTVHPMNQCDDLGSCSGHGVCNMRRCECFDGWTGPDCAEPARGGKSIPPWAIALIVLSSSALAGIFIIAAGYALQALGLAPATPPGSEDGDGDERQPLLIRLDADDGGSVGSADTSDCEDEVGPEEVERRVNRAIQRLQRRASTAEERRGGGEGGAPAAAAAAAAEADGPETAGERARESAVEVAQQSQPQPAGDAAALEGAAVPSPAAEPADAEAAPAAAAAADDLVTELAAADSTATAADDADEPQKHAGVAGMTPEGPLAMVDCSVCMSRPVQVVVVPCGHVCMCRRCSRRLQRCPMCRKEIARRQRLYV